MGCSEGEVGKERLGPVDWFSLIEILDHLFGICLGRVKSVGVLGLIRRAKVSLRTLRRSHMKRLAILCMNRTITNRHCPIVFMQHRLPAPMIATAGKMCKAALESSCVGHMIIAHP